MGCTQLQAWPIVPDVDTAAGWWTVECALLRAARCPLPESKDARLLQAAWGRACFATKVRRGRRKTAITGGRCEGPKSSKQKQQKKVFTATLRLFIADRERFRSLDLR